MITPTLRQLDIFAQMIAAGSIAECARELGMQPTDVEREIGILEGRLGLTLFDRQGGIVTLTDAGRKTVEAMQMLTETPQERWDDTHAPEAVEPLPVVEAQSYPAPERRPPAGESGEAITIAAHPSVFSHFQDALSAFEETNSDVAITLDLDTYTAAQAIPRLASGKVDIAYFYSLGEPQGWPSRYAWSEQLWLYIGSDHPLAQLEGVAVDDIKDVPSAALAQGNALRPLIEEALSSAGLRNGEIILETDNLYEIVVAVREGRGYFAAFGPLARDFSRMSGIRRLPLIFPLPSIDVRQGKGMAVQDDSMAATLSEYLFR